MNRSDIDKASLESLAQLVPSHLCWIVFSSLGITTNLLVLITIAFTKTLHNKSQFIVFSHSFAELFLMAAYFGIGLARYLAYALSYPQTSDHLSCALKLSPINVGSPILRAAVLALAVDRCLCMGVPIFYRNIRTRNYVVGLNVLIWAYGCTQASIGFAYLQTTPSLIPACNFAVAFDPKYNSATSVVSNVSVCIMAAIYLCAIWITFVRYKKMHFTGESQRSEWKRQMEFGALVAISVIGLIFLVSTGVTTVLNAFAVRMGNGQSTDVLVLFITSVGFVSSISHLFVYLKFNPRFRKGFRTIFCRSSQAVGPSG